MIDGERLPAGCAETARRFVSKFGANAVAKAYDCRMLVGKKDINKQRYWTAVIDKIKELQ